MRRPILLIAPMLITGAMAAEPPKPHNVLLFVADGLRPGMISPQSAPAIAALLKRGVTFSNTHAAFPISAPTLATTNPASIATGPMPGNTGASPGTIRPPRKRAASADSEPNFAAPNFANPNLADPNLANPNLANPNLANNEETLLRAAAAANISTATIGKRDPSPFADHADGTAQPTVIVDARTGHPGGTPLSPEMQTTLQEFGLANTAPAAADATLAGPATLAANAEQRKWFTDVAALATLPTFKDRHKPFVMVFWSHDPDNTPQNQNDSPMRLIPGINGPTALASIRDADADLARLLASLDEQGLAATTDVILTSVHGLSTISKESATSYAATRSYQNVPPGLLPPGFVAIDLAHALRMILFDPDAPAETRSTALPPGKFPLRGNGLIGDEATQPEVVVTANGGSDQIYLTRPDKLTAARIVQFLSAQDYTSGIFVDTRLGQIGATLPLSAVAPDGSALMPSIVINFRSFSVGCANPITCGVDVADTVFPQGQAAHGSFSRADTRIVMAAAGPDFRAGYDDTAPVSTADLGNTIAALLGLKMQDKGKQTGRVLTEALVHGASVLAKPGVLNSPPDDTGLITQLKYQAIGATRYFDAAGYPGRTLGLD